ncbi:hypothetical protein P9X10_01310 [Bacillus cereus]|nr:hypothetical protein [Bacillus cereus]
MLKIKQVSAKDSDIITVFVYDGEDNLLYQNIDHFILGELLDVLKINLPSLPLVSHVETITVKDYHIEVNLQTKEFTSISELPKSKTPIRAIVDSTKEEGNRVEVLGYVSTDGQTINLYKPSLDSNYYEHPYNILSARDFDNLPPFHLFM